ncbi:MAG: DEAD/DEAH box helicase, partial [Ectothiorhodospiraceae bacterium]
MRAHPAIQAYFDARGWSVLAFQEHAWAAYAAGDSGLIHAPTGTGKTLAAWFGPVQEWLAAADIGTSPLTVLWVTPLRALASDTTAQLRDSAAELGMPWTVEQRTGDATASQRRRQRRRLPSVLVTTPESLSLLLSDPDSATRFRDLACVVVDEWHELLGSKRGVQLELCLAHLRRCAPRMRTWGLSATLGNLQEARDVLTGQPDGGVLIRGPEPRRIAVDSIRPGRMERFPWAGHLGTRLVEPVLAALDRAGTSLLFTNTRSQAERWHQALLEARPDWFDRIALHHGSLDRTVREQVEAMLRAGSIRCVVATSSLDLGVDFSPVDQVLQVGSPKGVARLVQRAGRSGHQPDGASAVVCVPTHALELVEIAAAREAIAAGAVESRQPLRGCLDVLIQHLVTLAVGPGFTAPEQLAEVRSTAAYAGLGDEEWQWVLDFITTGGSTLRAYPEYRRVVCGDDGVYRVTDRTIARRHRMSVGTITADSMMRVQYQRGSFLGFIEEGFVSRLKSGESFVFAGRVLELVRVRDMAAQVRAARSRTRAVLRWMGGRMPLSTRLGAGVQACLDRARR